MINILSSSRYKINRHEIKTKAAALLSPSASKVNYLMNIVFVGKNKMGFLSKKYKKESVVLPVLSFPYHIKNKKGENFIGEVVICYPQAILLAAERQKKVDDIIWQLVQHGINNLLDN